MPLPRRRSAHAQDGSDDDVEYFYMMYSTCTDGWWLHRVPGCIAAPTASLLLTGRRQPRPLGSLLMMLRVYWCHLRGGRWPQRRRWEGHCDHLRSLGRVAAHHATAAHEQVRCSLGVHSICVITLASPNALLAPLFLLLQLGSAGCGFPREEAALQLQASKHSQRPAWLWSGTLPTNPPLLEEKTAVVAARVLSPPRTPRASAPPVSLSCSTPASPNPLPSVGCFSLVGAHAVHRADLLAFSLVCR